MSLLIYMERLLKRLNVWSMMKSRRQKRLESEIGVFIKQYKRKSHAGYDPNDRSYDRKIEKEVKGMAPAELDALMNGCVDVP